MLLSMFLDPALGLSFLWGAWQTWTTIQVRDKNEHKRMLRYWVVLCSLLYLLPWLDIVLFRFLGIFWSVGRVLLFWQIALSKNLGTGFVFSQYEAYAPQLESQIETLVNLGREVRSIGADFTVMAVCSIAGTVLRMCIDWISVDQMKGTMESLEKDWQMMQDACDNFDRRRSNKFDASKPSAQATPSGDRFDATKGGYDGSLLQKDLRAAQQKTRKTGGTRELDELDGNQFVFK